jgi:sugar/nucleoside kinase (ribokinase family)
MDDSCMEETPPVVSSIVPLCMIGNDDSGNKLLSLLEECGSDSRNVDTRVVRSEREKRPDIRTGLSILPIYSDGRRGCFFDAASNATFSPQQVMGMFGELSSTLSGGGNAATSYGALLFGYPHLLPMMQGKSLAYIFSESRKIMIDGGIVALDLNGVPRMSFARAGELRSVQDLKNDRVIGSALEHTDLLHMNEDELSLLTGCRLYAGDDEFSVAKSVELFLRCGVAVVAVTRGKKGSYVACNNAERFERSPML